LKTAVGLPMQLACQLEMLLPCRRSLPTAAVALCCLGGFAKVNLC
jgi:hypothetical protein